MEPPSRRDPNSIAHAGEKRKDPLNCPWTQFSDLSSEEEVSHIKHKTHFWLFLKHLPPTDADIILSMLDTESLFTNITQEQGLESVGHFLDTKPTKLPSTSFFITWLLLF